MFMSQSFVKDYVYHKLKGYSMVTQAVVDYNKCLTNVYVEMPWTFNDSHKFKPSNPYQKNIIIANLM